MVPGDLETGLFLYASGQIVDASGSVTGSFVFGFTPVPEPSILVLLAIGVVGLLGYAWRRKRVA